MKNLVLKNPSYEYLERGFAEWLDILGYCEMSVKNMPSIIREFLFFMESQPIGSIHELRQQHIKKYYSHVSSRANLRRGGGLSNNYLNKHLQAIEKFLEYLRHRGMQNVPTVGIKLEKLNTKEIIPLTEEEIKHLFNVTNREAENEIQEAINARDKAMLVVYYSCGLRRNEGSNLDLEDINLDSRIVHVRKGKNYKERFVPLNKTNAQYLQQYIYDYRPLLVKRKSESAFFIGKTGDKMTGGGLYLRLKLLQLQTDDIALQQKVIGLHTLRHSIATHLLAAGMQIEKLSRFLGHRSLESTQIYTHLVEKESEVLV
jgi:integrase/recombinase XerD